MVVDFYILQKQSPQSIFPFAYHLLTQAYEKEESVYVLHNNRQEAENFDRYLWSSEDCSFLPHCLSDNDLLYNETPIILGLKDSISEQNTIVMNLSHETVHFSNPLSKVIEIIPYDSKWLAAARKKYRDYQNSSTKIETYKV